MDRSHEFQLYTGVAPIQKECTDDVRNAIKSIEAKIDLVIKRAADELERFNIGADLGSLRNDVQRLRDIIANSLNSRRLFRRRNKTVLQHYEVVLATFDEMVDALEDELRLLQNPNKDHLSAPICRLTYISDRDMNIPPVEITRPSTPIKGHTYFGPTLSLQEELDLLIDRVNIELCDVDHVVKEVNVIDRNIDVVQDVNELQVVPPATNEREYDLYNELIQSEILLLQQKQRAHEDRNILQAQRKLNDINEMVSTFAKNIMDQADSASHLYKSTQDSSHFIAESLNELRKTIKNSNNKATKYVITFIVMVLFVNTLDLIF